MKYSEAKKAIEGLSSKYSAYKDADTDFFNVFYKNGEVAYLKTNEQYSLVVWNEKSFKNLPFSNKLYMILSELAMTPLDDRDEENKYYIKIRYGFNRFLNINTLTGDMSVFSATEAYGFKTKFNYKEIEQLKRRNDIPLDWDKMDLVKADD